MGKNRTCILVLGMHRSGTSAVTRVLNLLGAALPDTLMPTHETNAAGFWESQAFMEVNDALLAEAGSSWDDWTIFDESVLPPDRIAAFEVRLEQTIETELRDSPVIVLKDPRIARLVPLYLRILKLKGFDVRCVHITRNPSEVAQSLGLRDGFPTAFSQLLWLRHTLDAERASRGCDRIFVTYQELMSDGKSTIRRLAEWGTSFGLSDDPLSRDIAATHLQGGLRHFDSNEDHLSRNEDQLSRLIATTYGMIASLGGEPMRAETLVVLDECIDLLNGAAELSGPAFVDLTGKMQSLEYAQRVTATELAAAQSENEILRKIHAAELETARSIHAAELETARSIHATELETAWGIHATELETARGIHATELATARHENKLLRKAITKILRNPLVPLRDKVRYHGALKLSKLLEKAMPAQSRKYSQSAAKRDPKRFKHAPPAGKSKARHFTNIANQVGGLERTPTVVLPFTYALTHNRPIMRVAVVLHVYYLEQAEFFLDALRVLPVPFSLFVSTDTEEKAISLRKTFAAGPAKQTEVRVVPNHGRDIAPKLVGFADIYKSQDLILFLHTKAAQHDTARLSGWRDYLIKSLLGSQRSVESILDAFAVAPELGIVAPPNLPVVREYMEWSVNFEASRALAARLGTDLSIDSPIDFPAGSMFWARPEAIQPLLDAKIRLEDFPEEADQTDATFAHAVERLFFYSCEAAGLRWFHAGAQDQFTDWDRPLYVENQLDLEWALSDQMPALLLPGTRPRPKSFPNSEARLAAAKQDFRAQCMRDLNDFLASDERLIFKAVGDVPKLSIVLVLYNQAELTLHCLKSLWREADLPVEIIVLDNGSSDDTAAVLDRLDGVTIIQNEENLHFLRGVNRAAKAASGEYVLLLNNDVRVLPGSISNAVVRLEEDEGIGAVGGPIILLDGTLQEAGSIIFDNGACQGYGRGRDPGEAEFQFCRDVDYCSGAFLMMRRALWEELGGFDDAFAPAYYEETDLCMRIWESGRRVVYDPSVRIVHFEFGSSTKSDAAIALMKRNADIFFAKHTKALSSRHLPREAPLVQSRQRRESAPRLLIIDDRVPLPNLGAGYPRAARMLAEIGAAGWSATLYPTAVPYFSCTEAYKVIPATTELTLGEPFVPLADFLRSRVGCFDAILVSRPHNMVRFRNAVDEVAGWERVPVLYDAEAIFAERNAALAQLVDGKAFDYREALESELALAAGVQTVFSVSSAEANTFRAHGYQDVRVLGHALQPRPLGAGPEGRRNMLFVGALYNSVSPNTDSLDWFVRTIMPRIDAAIGSDWCLNVAGRGGAEALRALQSDRVRILGEIDDLDSLYAEARLFIAPTRYAAGIPMKVHEAASVGLPTVATDLLARQLGWTHGQELMSAADADSFAASCVTLYTDDALWSRLRAGGLAAVRRDCAPGAFGDTLRLSLNNSLLSLKNSLPG